MESHENIFRKRYPGKTFVPYDAIAGSDAELVAQTLMKNFRQSGDLKFIDFLNSVIGNRTMVHSDLDESNFHLREWIKNPSDKLYINYRDLSEIYIIKSDDIDRFFDDIYFPSSDDIDIFDRSFSWILHINHEREVFLCLSGSVEEDGQ